MKHTKTLVITFLISFFITSQSFAWGGIGHYVIGKLAEWHMKEETDRKSVV